MQLLVYFAVPGGIFLATRLASGAPTTKYLGAAAAVD
jgi:hypothetical protein